MGQGQAGNYSTNFPRCVVAVTFLLTVETLMNMNQFGCLKDHRWMFLHSNRPLRLFLSLNFGADF